MVFLFVLKSLTSGGNEMEDISKEDILAAINSNIEEYDLMDVRRFVNTFREELLMMYNIFNKVPQEMAVVSMYHSMSDVQAEVLYSVARIDEDLYKDLYAIYSGNDEKNLCNSFMYISYALSIHNLLMSNT